MDVKTLYRASVLAVLGVVAGCATAPPASAQNEATISVLERGRQGFLVRVEGAMGSTPEEAGLQAMARACELSRARGFTHMTVEDFRTDSHSFRVQTRRGGTEYHGGTDGRIVGARTTRGEHRTVTRGQATLSVYMIGADTAQSMITALQIIDAQSCMVLNSGN